MELKEGMSVFTRGGEEVGKVNRFVIDPMTNEVTHIVLQKGWLLPEDKVVPFDMLNTGREDKLVLNEEVDDFDQLPPFEETHFVRATDDQNNGGTAVGPTLRYAPAYYWYPGLANMGQPGLALRPYPWAPAETERNIPENTVPLKEGADVISSDGEHVGDVERLFVDPDSNKATHFLISQGLLFKDRKLIPAHWAKAVKEDEVQLAVPTRVLEGLPSYEE